MKSKKELKKSLASNMLSKFIVYIMVAITPFFAIAEPVLNDVTFPPSSFTFVDDKSTLDDLGLSPEAWCYDSQANSIIITAPARERARCELRLMYELEKQKTKHEFNTKKLQLRIDTLTSQYDEVNTIKDREIERLTDAVLKRPNDNNIWWGAGGVVVGVTTTLLVGWLIVSAQGGFDQ